MNAPLSRKSTFVISLVYSILMRDFQIFFGLQ